MSQQRRFYLSRVPRRSSSPLSGGIQPRQGGIDDMLGSLDIDIGDQSPKRDTNEKEFIDEDKLLNFD